MTTMHKALYGNTAWGTPSELLLLYLHVPDMGSTLKFTNLYGK